MTLKNNGLIVLLVLIAGCKQMPQVSVPTLPGLGPYKIDIQQGNVITQEMLDKLQPGMTRSQVRFVLGTPLLVDPFRTDRWDYVFTMNKKGERIEQRQLKVFFQDDKMVRYEGDTVAAARRGTEAVAADKAIAKPIEKPAVVPVVKPQPAASAPAAPVVSTPARQPEIAKPVMPSLPAREGAADTGKPQLQMVPSPGEPAKPEDLKPPAPVAATPSDPETLDAPPLPRLVLPPEQPEPASTFVTVPHVPIKPAAAPVAVKPAAKASEKPPAATGFFGRLFGGSPRPAQPGAASGAQPAATVKPVVTPTPAAVAAPAPAAVEKPVTVQPEVKPVVKPVAITQKPVDKASTERGFFGRMLDGMRNPAPPIVIPGAAREVQPGLPPPPFVDPDPVPATTKP